MKQVTNIFYLGKGGVGKSTAAALNSIFLAQKGFEVVIASLDPAHNQSDIFATRLSDKPRQIIPHLAGVEIDQEYWIRRYLKDVHEQISRTYRYLTAFNLEKYFKVIRHSPGLEEYALILAFKEIRQRHSDCDFLILDMAPTALSLKFFNLPTLSLIWINHLLALRKEIVRKRKLITKIRLIKKDIERDKVLTRIDHAIADYLALKTLFEDPRLTKINLVLNPDELSLAESVHIFKALKKINISLSQIVLNKMCTNSLCLPVSSEFPGIPLLELPFSGIPLIGIETLKRFLESHEDVMREQPLDNLK